MDGLKNGLIFRAHTAKKKKKEEEIRGWVGGPSEPIRPFTSFSLSGSLLPPFPPQGREEGGEEKFKWGLRRNYAERREGGRSALKSGGGTLSFLLSPRSFPLPLSQKKWGEATSERLESGIFSLLLFSTKSDEDESFLLGVTPPPWLYVLYILLSETMRRSAKWERAPNRICPSSLTLHLLKE